VNTRPVKHTICDTVSAIKSNLECIHACAIKYSEIKKLYSEKKRLHSEKKRLHSEIKEL